MRATGIGLHLLPARDYEKPWLHSNIYLEGLGYPRASSQGPSWECWAFTDPPSGWEQPRPTRTGVLDPGLWTLPSVPGRTTTHPRLNEVGTSWLFSKKVKTRHNPAKQAAADKNTISQKHPEKCVRFLSVQSLSGPCLAPRAHGQASLVFLPRSQEEHAEGLPCNRAGRTKAASLLPLPLNTGGTRSSAHIHLAGKCKPKRTSQNRGKKKRKKKTQTGKICVYNYVHKSQGSSGVGRLFARKQGLCR